MGQNTRFDAVTKALMLVLLSLFTVQASMNRNASDRREENGNRLQVHIVPHSHDDAGWLKTFDQYYYGLRQDIQPAAVQVILDSVVEQLTQDANRRFTFAEMAFFMKYWSSLGESSRNQVSKLVAEDRLNFVNGGYVQHDEATAHFVAQLDQTTRGHLFLKETFNLTPSVGWQIDPFGHSLTQTTLLGQSVGFDSVMFGRSDYQDLAKRRHDRELEMVWGSSEDSHSSVFAVNFASGNYGPPTGFWWEWGSSPDSIIVDDINSQEYNVKERVDLFVERCKELANVTRGRDILVLMGSDFNYNNARYWFQSLDKLIHYSNLDGRVHAFYSSPEDYVSAKATYNVKWPRKKDDFFPYADFGHAYWTGYFSSRSNSKRFIRQATAYLQAARQMEAFAGVFSVESSTDSLEEAISLLQHHDAITGTARQHVVNDYHRRLHKALLETAEKFQATLSHLLGFDQSSLPRLTRQKLLMNPDQNSKTLAQLPIIKFKTCFGLNISSCEATSRWSDEGEKGLVVVYNPLSWPRTSPIRIPIRGQSRCGWHVHGPNGKILSSQVIGISNATREIQELSARVNATDAADHGSTELVFEAELPPLGFSNYVVQVHRCTEQELSGRNDESGSSSYETHKDDELLIANDHVSVHFNRTTGLMTGLKFEDGRMLPLSIDFWWYNASDGCETSEGGGQASGAYIFRPNGCYRVREGPVTLELIHGDLVQEVRQVFEDWATLNTRLYKGQRHLEIEWTVGPIPWEDNYGKEVILRYTTGLESEDEWFTDANGRYMIRRRRNYRPSWDLNVTENISGNYYPATSAVSLKDKVNNWQFSVILDRAQGVSSLSSGEIELMLHRRLLNDDGRGVGQALNETICGCTLCECPGIVARGIHWIVADDLSRAPQRQKLLQQSLNDPPVLVFADLKEFSGYDLEKILKSHSFSKGQGLHDGIHLLTFKKLTSDTALVRFAHLFEENEDPSYGRVLEEDAGAFLQKLGCKGPAVEVTASGNQNLSTAVTKRRLFTDEILAYGKRSALANDTYELDNWKITLNPMEVRTFRVKCA